MKIQNPAGLFILWFPSWVGDVFLEASLQIKKTQDPRHIWEGRITRGYRFTFQMEDEVGLLRRLGPQDILKTP